MILVAEFADIVVLAPSALQVQILLFHFFAISVNAPCFVSIVSVQPHDILAPADVAAVSYLRRTVTKEIPREALN